MQFNKSLYIGNRGQEISSTNYFDSSQASAGLLYLSWNAGAGRLLVPDNQKSWIREMKTGKYVIVSVGPWIETPGTQVIELLFEDKSPAPFSITIAESQSDRSISISNKNSEFPLIVYTRDGEKMRLPGRLRKAAKIPCLAPWS